MCSVLEFRSTSSIGKYLGIPIKHQGQSNQDFNFILDRMKQKLSRWKENLVYSGQSSSYLGFIGYYSQLYHAMCLPSE